MPLSLYLDDCSDDDNLITFLRQAGHSVISPRDLGMRGADDPDHLEDAAQRGWVLLAANPDDFKDLHADWQLQGRKHSGIFLVYDDNDPTKDIKPRDVVHAIANLLNAGVLISNEVHTLNHWR